MASPAVLDFDTLLAPISADQPAGVELKSDASLSAVYYQLKDRREAARVAERQLAQQALYGEDEAGSVTPPDWKAVRELACDVIATKSKDLWAAAWLVEALTRLSGFAGLRDGFRLARELAEQFWDGIHPQPDDEGYLTTVAQLAGLNGEDSEGALIAPIDAIPITQGSSFRPLTSADYKQAVDVEQIADPQRRAQRIERGAVSLQMFERAVSETPADFFRELLEDLDQSLDEFQRLGQALEERCGQTPEGYSAAPPASAIRGALEACRERVAGLTRHLFGPEAGADAAGGDAAGQPPPGGTLARASGSAGPVATREDAFRALLQVADFFRRTEPHSPVSYALEQAVRWGRMPLPELFGELISDEAIRTELFRRIGIPRPPAAE